MPLRSLYGLTLLALALGLAGCVPRPSSQEEEKCPFYLDGRDRLVKQDYSGARRSFEKALEANPRSALAHYELGLLSEQREHDYISALYHYQRVLKLRDKGYPADPAKERIRSCRQEVVKGETLSPLDRGMVKEMEQLRGENAQLRQQVDELKKSLAQRSAEAADKAAKPASGPARTARGPTAWAGAGARAHVVKRGETAYAVTRYYGLSLGALQRANPGVRLDRLVTGQRLNLPER